MYHKRSSKRQLVIRTLVYSLMTLSVIVLVSVLMLAILGYSFNQRDGRLEQGGLLQFASVPSGATVTLDDQILSARTPTKSSVEANNHHVLMNLAGYRTWQKSISVQPGGIAWLSYARLIPTEVETEALHEYPVLSSSLASPGRRWMLLHESADAPKFILANLQSDTVKYSTLALPETVFTAPAPETPGHVFTPVEWSQDARFILVKHTYNNNQTEWLVLNREAPEESLNLTKELAMVADKAVFGSSNGRRVIIRGEGNIRSLNLDNLTVSRPLVANVEEFSLYGAETIIYTSLPDPATNTRHVGYVTDEMDAPVVVRSYPATDTALLRMSLGKYFDREYVAILHGNELDVSVGKLPRDDTPLKLEQVTKRTVSGAPMDVALSRNGRFVTVQRAEGFSVYDIELRKYDETAFTRPAGVQTPLTWLDDYVIWSDNGGTLRVYDFDGANQQDIGPIAEGFGLTLSDNDRYIYSIGRNDAGFVLQRSRLIIQ